MSTLLESTRLISALQECVGANHVLTTDADMAGYAEDWRKKYHGRPAAVVCPGTAEEVAAVVRAVLQHGATIVPQGGNTGLSGGATPDASGNQVVVSTTRLNRIREIDTANDTIVVEAGVVLAQLQEAALQQERLFPLTLASEGSCTIGGNLASNAGGNAVLRYGNMRDLTLGLEVVTAQGAIWNGLRGLRKDNTGYDLRNLYVGSEGTLGIITAATLKLFPQPKAALTAFMALNGVAAAVDLLNQAREALGPGLTAFEVISQPCVPLLAKHFPGLRWPFDEPYPVAVLIELSDHDSEAHARQTLERLLENAFEAGGVADGVVAESLTQSRALWALRESISEAQGLEGMHIKHDISLPISAIAGFIPQTEAALAALVPGVRVAWFGHMGDGNLHFNVLAPEGHDPAAFSARQPALNLLVHDLVVERQGSISAEHGLGRLRRDENQRYKSREELALQRAVKQALDPHNIMNPGIMIIM